MKILIADDDLTSRAILEAALIKKGYEVVAVDNGDDAWQALQSHDTPSLVILDWMMPGLNGPEVCRKVREMGKKNSFYILLLTSRDEKKDIVEGLGSGADDFLSKPFDVEELYARIEVGKRIINLEGTLANRIKELEEALNHVKTLQGVIPICMYCHKIRNDKQSWERLEMYISKHSEAEFSHGVCDQCLEERHPGV